jgi:hypothetical protein
MRFLQFIMLVIYCGQACCPAHASVLESYRYTETIGKIENDIHWCVDKSEPIRLLYQGKGETHITQTDESYATVQWDMEKKSEDTSLHALRQPHTIIIQGRWKGRQITKEFPVDDTPWYQATSWSLRGFILSSRKKIRFWTVRIDTLEVHKITAVKKDVAVLNVHGAEEEAAEVELRLGGLLAMFWKSSYWFRPSDGVFLRFEGPSGPPGAPAIVVEYRGPAGPCELNAVELSSGPSQDAF